MEITYRIFRKGGGGGGGNHLTPPHYQETVLITNSLTARIRLWKKIQGVFVPFCCNSCHFAAVCALIKPPYYNTCADSKGGGGGGGISEREGRIRLVMFLFFFTSNPHNTILHCRGVH